MIQIVEQTHEERVKMYMRCMKKELAEMLANRQELDDSKRWAPQDTDLKTDSTTWSPSHPIVTAIAYTPNT